MATVRCKFRLNTVTKKLGSRAKYDEAGKHIGYEEAELYDAQFSAVYGEQVGSENKWFWDATPAGTFSVSTIKEMPWELGQEYYLDISPAG